MSRQLADWLDAYLEYTEESEPPKSYHTWCGLSVIAGALQRRCHFAWGFERIFPNLFIVLVGPSGRARKGIALGIAKDLLQEAGIPLTANSTSREALILAMKEAVATYQDGTAIKMHCSITAFSEELSVFLGEKNIGLLSNLTDWYDSKDRWDYRTISRGKDHLDGLCLNVCGGTAPDWLPSMLPKEAVGGGFTSRVIWVVESKKGKRVEDPKITPRHQQLERQLIMDLNQIKLLMGTFEFEPKARKAYTEWYACEDDKLDQGIMPVDDSRFHSYCDRRATHLRKLMMILSASHRDDLKMGIEDFNRAKDLLESVEVRMAETFSGLSVTKYGELTDRVLSYIRTKGTVKRSEVYRRFYKDMDGDALQQIENTLGAMKVIDITLLPSENDTRYKWKG